MLFAIFPLFSARYLTTSNGDIFSLSAHFLGTYAVLVVFQDIRENPSYLLVKAVSSYVL